MKLTSREFNLGFLTLVMVVLGGTYWWAMPKIVEWKKIAQDQATLNRRRASAERRLGRQDEVNERLDAFRAQLPRYPMGQDVAPEFSSKLNQTANSHNVTLLRRNTEQEKSAGDLYELAISCTWEAGLDSIVRFLYALQSQGAMLDIRQVTIQPGRTVDELKGSFTVDYAFSRSEAGLDSVKVEQR